MKYLIDPAEPIMGQLRSMGIPEHLPVKEAMVYRFFDEGNRLLYVGVTVSPRGRWQAHKKTAPWWPDVRAVSVKFYPYERAALDAEVTAIKAERPPFNRRSALAGLTRDSCTAHESRMSVADIILPRVGGGVGVGGREEETHPSTSVTGRRARGWRLTVSEGRRMDGGYAARGAQR